MYAFAIGEAMAAVFSRICVIRIPNPSTDGGTRTRTTLSGQRILSPLRLPFRHIGVH
jgi:hypothetical protein